MNYKVVSVTSSDNVIVGDSIKKADGVVVLQMFNKMVYVCSSVDDVPIELNFEETVGICSLANYVEGKARRDMYNPSIVDLLQTHGVQFPLIVKSTASRDKIEQAVDRVLMPIYFDNTPNFLDRHTMFLDDQVEIMKKASNLVLVFPNMDKFVFDRMFSSIKYAVLPDSPLRKNGGDLVEWLVLTCEKLEDSGDKFKKLEIFVHTSSSRNELKEGVFGSEKYFAGDASCYPALYVSDMANKGMLISFSNLEIGTDVKLKLQDSSLPDKEYDMCMKVYLKSLILDDSFVLFFDDEYMHFDIFKEIFESISDSGFDPKRVIYFNSAKAISKKMLLNYLETGKQVVVITDNCMSNE